jgi:hypothetical protein
VKNYHWRNFNPYSPFIAYVGLYELTKLELKIHFYPKETDTNSCLIIKNLYKQSEKAYWILTLKDVNRLQIHLTINVFTVSDSGTEGVFIWTTSGLSMSYNNWYSSSSSSNTLDSDCVRLMYATTRKWMMEKCSETIYALCQSRNFVFYS